MSFVYNEESRIHTLNGKVIPSVSNIVAPLGMDYSKAHPGKLAQKKALGVAFHDCIRLFLNNDLDEDSVDDDLKYPMQQFQRFYERILIEEQIVAIEQPICNEKLKYAGKPDLVTEYCIYDWKLRKYDAVCDPLRMAGYAGLVGGFPTKNKVVVEFSLDGDYRIHDADKNQAWPVFRKMLEFYKLCEKWKGCI